MKGGRKPENPGENHLTIRKQNLAFPHVTRARLEPQRWDNVTMNASDISIPFLDVLFKLSGNKVSCDLYSKPTDMHNYLNFHSCHPRHTDVNIPSSLASFLSSDYSDRQSIAGTAIEWTTYLRKQGYPDELIRNGVDRADRMSDRVIPCVTTYCPRNTNIFTVDRAVEQLFLRKNDRMRNVLKRNK